nr:ubiquitin carboxyl-terminal hydrolase 12-like [Ipomoea batatas]
MCFSEQREVYVTEMTGADSDEEPEGTQQQYCVDMPDTDEELEDTHQTTEDTQPTEVTQPMEVKILDVDPVVTSCAFPQREVGFYVTEADSDEEPEGTQQEYYVDMPDTDEELEGTHHTTEDTQPTELEGTQPTEDEPKEDPVVTSCTYEYEVDGPTSVRLIWTIENFSRSNAMGLYSGSFSLGRGYQWYWLIMFPKGYKGDDHLWIYLDVADSSELPSGWIVDALFSISVFNHIQDEMTKKECYHKFNERESNWGFKFMPLIELNDPNRGFLVFDTIVVEATVTLCEKIDYDSKKETGYVRHYQAHGSQVIVRFRSLEKPSEDEFTLEFLKEVNYDKVIQSVARYLGLDDPLKIRLTSHNYFTQCPMLHPIKYRGVRHLLDMLIHHSQVSDILYYEVLDIQLPKLEDLKTLKVAFCPAKIGVTIYTITLTNQSTVLDVLDDLKSKVELSHPDAELRLLEIFCHKIRKIFPPHERIGTIDHHRTLRAEEIPEEEKNLGPHDHLIHVCHFMHTTQNEALVTNFGEPFILVLHESEILAEIKARIQKKLQVLDDEFLKWKFALVSRGYPKYLEDSDILSKCFEKSEVCSDWEQYLGMEHTDNNAPKCPNSSILNPSKLEKDKAP